MPWIKDGIEYTELQLRATHTNTAFQSPIPPAVAAEFGYTWQDTLPPERLVPGQHQCDHWLA